MGASSIVRPGIQSPFVLDQMADTQTLALSSVDTRTQRVATGGHWKANRGTQELDDRSKHQDTGRQELPGGATEDLGQMPPKVVSDC